jgi:Uma2 family endonuclease
MTEPVARQQWRGPWTIDDLADTPDNGNRYEIFDGSLLVSPPPAIPHASAVVKICRLLDAQPPEHLVAVENLGVLIRGGRSLLVPDLTLIRAEALERAAAALRAPDALLVIEVLSPGNAGRDLVIKRHEYAAGGIPQYWIVDKNERILTVLTRPEQGKGYLDATVVKAGERFETDDPFPISLDPADFC